MKLYYSAVSPYVRKIVILAAELGLASSIEHLPVSLSPYAPNVDVIALNPLGKIPVLETHDGAVLYDSTVIAEYLLSIAPGSSLLPSEPKARFETLTRASLADGILDAAQVIRFETARPEGFCYPKWVEGQQGKIVRGIALFEQQLPKTFDLAAIGLCSTLAWIDLRIPDLDWRADAPRLAQWFEEVASRPSVHETRFPQPTAA